MSPSPSPAAPLPLSTPAAQAYAERAVALGRASGVAPTGTVAYGPLAAHRFEVFEPAVPEGAPVLAFLHGGAWTHGELEWLRLMAPAVTGLSAVFIGVTYRLAPEHRWPACFDDACRALAFLERFVRKQGYDASRVILGGHSAGGHLAALATLRMRPQWLKACFPVSSRFDLRHANPAPGSGEERVYKMLFSEPAQDVDASPLLCLDGNATPFHITWGGSDFERVATSSQAMVDAMQQRGMPVSHAVVPGADHFAMHLQLADPGNRWYARLMQEMRPC